MQNRQSALNKWLEETLHLNHYFLSPLTGDASFRRYFRLQSPGMSRIVMDAPPGKETLKPFVTISALLRQTGILTPAVHAYDERQGFALLDDFGDTLLLSQLKTDTVEALYGRALDTLVNLQACPVLTPDPLPVFDVSFIIQELNIFKTWFIGNYLQLKLDAQEEAVFKETFEWLSEEIAHQPRVFIHRDYHSRNIMLLENNSQLGIIDFQDAMSGPLTYDLVSLLKDCYIQWSQDQVLHWTELFYERSPVAKQQSLQAFIRDFELCGLQRHLKVLGVFSRLSIRDNKPGYLQDLPLTLHYTMACLESCETLRPFYEFMQDRVRLP